MKKTFTLILAAAGVAMAATEIDLTDKWEGDTADISSETFTEGKATFFLTLNLEQLDAWTTADGNVSLGYLSADNTNNATTVLGTSINSQFSTIRNWRNNGIGDSFQGTISTLPLPDDIDGVEYAYATLVSYVYTSGNNSKIKTDMYLWSKDLELVDELTSNTSTLGSTFLSGISYSSFTLNSDYVYSDQVALYNGQLSEDQNQYEIAKSLLPAASTPGTDSTVPEPTTATLSLLALAGLAARRRRK
ncbi:MAG: PEP-CTERM sorting domain-containing protein [Akkermansia sp.]|nr:PEP-CTERM sorting domain-containing protein [Akkermansia sp.]